MTHDINPECAAHFSSLDERNAEVLRRVTNIEHDLEGNAKPGMKQDVAELKRDVEDVCSSNSRIEETLDKFVKDYRASNEGDKNRGLEIKKVFINNSGQIALAVVQMLMLLWFWQRTGVTP
jgi:DNA-directed RNA polymerase delta subunit